MSLFLSYVRSTQTFAVFDFCILVARIVPTCAVHFFELARCVKIHKKKELHYIFFIVCIKIYLMCYFIVWNHVFCVFFVILLANDFFLFAEEKKNGGLKANVHIVDDRNHLA